MVCMADNDHFSSKISPKMSIHLTRDRVFSTLKQCANSNKCLMPPKKFDITSGADYKGISYFPTKKPFVTFIKLFTRYS